MSRNGISLINHQSNGNILHTIEFETEDNFETHFEEQFEKTNQVNHLKQINKEYLNENLEQNLEESLEQNFEEINIINNFQNLIINQQEKNTNNYFNDTNVEYKEINKLNESDKLDEELEDNLKEYLGEYEEFHEDEVESDHDLNVDWEEEESYIDSIEKKHITIHLKPIIMEETFIHSNSNIDTLNHPTMSHEVKSYIQNVAKKIPLKHEKWDNIIGDKDSQWFKSVLDRLKSSS